MPEDFDYSAFRARYPVTERPPAPEGLPAHWEVPSDLFERLDRAQRDDYELSERIGAELLAELW